MSRRPRTRSRSSLVQTTTFKGSWNGAPVSGTYDTLNNESCSDYIGRPIADSNFSLGKRDRGNFSVFHGTAEQTSPPGKVVVENYLPLWSRGWSAQHLVTDAPPVSGQGATVLSRSNPSRSNIVPLTLIQDLHDIPRMLKSVGRLIRTPRRLLSPKEQANQFLGAKFGWLPLVDDVQKLLHVGQYIDARKRELDRLYSGQGLKRRIRLGEGTTEQQSGVTTWDSSAWFQPHLTGRTSLMTYEEVWGTVRWKPTSTPGHNPTDAQKMALAIQLCSGLTREALFKGAWDVLPWTWMIDWFSNAGDWLTQSSSTVPAVPTSTNIMRRRVTTVAGQIVTQPQWLQGGGGVGIYTSKERSVQTGSLSAHLPTLDGDRLSVLAALFVQRFRR